MTYPHQANIEGKNQHGREDNYENLTITRDIKHSNGLALLASYSSLKDNDKEELDNKME